MLFCARELEFGLKIHFCYTTPDFVDGLFVALGETVDFAPSDRFFDFSFLRNGRFRRKENWPTRQKVFPHLTVGAPSVSSSPSALSEQALRINLNLSTPSSTSSGLRLNLVDLSEQLALVSLF